MIDNIYLWNIDVCALRVLPVCDTAYHSFSRIHYNINNPKMEESLKMTPSIVENVTTKAHLLVLH